MRIVDTFPRKVRNIENVWIPMPDGCRLAARIWLPDDAEEDPVPAVLECMPYRKRDFTRLRDEPLHHYFAGYGYAAIRLDLRGTGDSEGICQDEYSPQELDDIVEVIAWIVDQRWCTGGVGMFGISWGGFNSLQVAARRPPGLKTIITLCSTDDRYADDAHYKGGCLLSHNLLWGSIFMSSVACPPDPEVVGPGWRKQWQHRLDNAVLYPGLWMQHPHRDAYWKHGSVCEDFDAIECPVYAVGGWSDGYSNAIPRLLAGLRVPRKGLIGPWSHAFPHNALPGPSIGFFQEMRRWWDYWLKGEETGIMDEPMLRVWMEEYLPPAPFHEYRPGRWVAEEAWPSPRITPRRLYLNVLSLGEKADPEDRMRVASPQTTGIAAGDWYGFGGEGESPIDQREDDGRSLVFDSDPLTEILEILGAPTVSLDLEVNRPVASVVVRLNDVAPDGASTRISYGVLNLTQRKDREFPQPMEPGRRCRVSVRLNDIAYSFAPGHTLRLAVSTSYWPMVWPAPEAVRLTLYTGSSWLELPQRPQRDADSDLPEFESPERGPRSEFTELRAVPLRRRVERDLITNTTVYRISSDGGDFGGAALARLDDIGLTVGYTVETGYTVHEYDPATAHQSIEQHTVHRRGDWSTEVRFYSELRSDPETFYLLARLEAYEGDELFVQREWDEQISRRML